MINAGNHHREYSVDCDATHYYIPDPISLPNNLIHPSFL